jgi:hypothetical protein
LANGFSLFVSPQEEIESAAKRPRKEAVGYLDTLIDAALRTSHNIGINSPVFTHGITGRPISEQAVLDKVMNAFANFGVVKNSVLRRARVSLLFVALPNALSESAKYGVWSPPDAGPESSQSNHIMLLIRGANVYVTTTKQYK